MQYREALQQNYTDLETKLDAWFHGTKFQAVTERVRARAPNAHNAAHSPLATTSPPPTRLLFSHPHTCRCRAPSTHMHRERSASTHVTRLFLPIGSRPPSPEHGAAVRDTVWPAAMLRSGPCDVGPSSPAVQPLLLPQLQWWPQSAMGKGSLVRHTKAWVSNNLEAEAGAGAGVGEWRPQQTRWRCRPRLHWRR